MPIQTAVAPRQSWKLLIAAVVCLGFGIWGAYDYWVRIPQEAEAAASFQQLQERFKAFEQKDGRGQITDADRLEWAKVRDEIDAFAGKVPEPPPKWDRPVQLWVYVIGCGVLGTPWCLWALWSLSRRNMRLEEDGTLVHLGGRWGPDEVVDIEMNKWMEKSIARLVHRDGRTLLLDDYKYKNMNLVVGHYASRFHPEDWHEDARQIKRAQDEQSTQSVPETV